MKWYFASRMKHKEMINEIINHLKKHGHEVVYEWSIFGSLKPYKDNAEVCSRVASEISKALKDVDVFVLLSDEAGTDMFVELGIVISNNNGARVYAVGEFNDRSLMHFHPLIKRVEKISDVFRKECPEIVKEDYKL